MTPSQPFQFHREAAGDVAAGIGEVFDYLDDPRHLAEHMESSSPMMAGSSMRIDVDGQGGRRVGSQIRMTGRVLGLSLAVEEAITEYAPPRRKVWQTFGEPRLLVIAGYRMGVDLRPGLQATHLCVWIDYDLPRTGVQRWLGLLLGAMYARWCTEQMLRSCQKRFEGGGRVVVGST
jgi:hypothetical protein